MRITVNAAERQGEFNHFWNSTGFTPASLLLDEDMRQQLVFWGAIPRKGIQYVRIHFLLTLLKASGLNTQNPRYDWTDFDSGMDALIKNRLRPIFEVMGNPSGYFSDFNNDGQLHAWRRMVRDVALHCMRRYGKEEVEQWYFETWNEPDVGWWHQWPQDTGSFCRYYDACSEGLLEANPKLRFGGPGTWRSEKPMFVDLMEHCDQGTNYFTGESGVRIDFISVHVKGSFSCREDVDPNSRMIIEKELAARDYLREHHPDLADRPFMNNECDPIIGWGATHTWHGRPYYAAYNCKVIGQHRRAMVEERGLDYPILSNDNGFLGEWGNRTMMTRFRPDGEEPPKDEFALVKKPAFALMELLSLMGDTAIHIDGLEDPLGDIGALATVDDDGRVAICIYNSTDAVNQSGEDEIELEIAGLPMKNGRMVHYRVDANHGDVFDLWQKAVQTGIKMAIRSGGLVKEIRKHQEPRHLIEPTDFNAENGSVSLNFTLPRPGVSVILLCPETPKTPAVPQGIGARTYKGMTDEEEVLIWWEPSNSPYIRTYEVAFSEEQGGVYSRVNEADLISSAFLHLRKTRSGRGSYRIRAIDYWGKTGDWSAPIVV